MSVAEVAVPTPSKWANGDSQEFWEALADGRLLLQQCDHCGHRQHPPRYMCSVCWTARPKWLECSGDGLIESVTVVRRAPLPEFRVAVPYVIAAVTLAEGPRMIVTLIGPDAEQARIGDAVQVIIAQEQDGSTLPKFRRVGTAS